MNRLIAFTAAAMLAVPSARAASPSIEPMLTTPLVFGGITISHEGRRFSPFRPQAPGAGPQLAEWVNGEPKPYPDAAWNDWKSGQDPRNAFVGVNAIRIGPDGGLWVVDVGSTGIGKLPEIGGPKLVRIDLATNKVSRIYPLGTATWPSSYIDDVRFKGRTAYLTDAGAPGLIVLDLDSGKSRRVLEGDKTAAQQRPLTAEGKPILSPDKLPVMLHSDQIEISPDGKWLYYQPVTGPLYRIETRWIDDASLDDKERASRAEKFANTANTGATVMDSSGNIYASDLDTLAIRKITPNGRMTTVLQDPRLLWVDAMWIDEQGYLWMPASQQNRAKAMNGGVSTLQPTSTIYRVKLDIKPLAD
jgi:sugar lactone lactonase YvrE